MANDYFTETGDPATNSRGRSSLIRALMTAIGDGFDKLAALTGNGGKLVRINSGATAQEAMSFGTANQVLGMNSGATGYEHKTVAGTANEITVTHGANSITASIPSAVTLTGKTITGGTLNSVTLGSPTMTTPTLGTPASGTLTNCTGLPVSTGISGLGTGVATFLATPSSANLASAVTDETGSGALVFATSPTLVTPAIGTPSSGTLTNCTGLPVATGISGLGSGVATFLATPSSANLRSAITDESGSGALLFANGDLGTPSAGVLTNCTGLPVAGGGTGASSASGARTALGLAIGTDVQAYDADLAAIAALSSTGMVVRTGSGTAAVRTLTQGSGVTITNGDGVSGNPTIAVTPGVGLGDVLGPGVAVDGEIALYDGITGQLIKRASTTGMLKATSGVLAAASAGTDYVAPGGALGTPSSGTLTNCSGLPQSGVTGLTTADSPQFAGINIGHASDTTLTRVSAGVVAVEGATVYTQGGALGTPASGTLTNCTGLPEAGLTLSDNTTADVSTTKHGFVPKAPNDTTKFLRGDGTWATAPSLGVLLSEVTASNSATVDVETTFDSTYDVYIIVAHAVKLVDDGIGFRCRLKLGGAYATANYMFHSNLSTEAAATYAGSASASSDGIYLCNNTGNASSKSLAFHLFLGNVTSTTEMKLVDWAGVRNLATAANSVGFVNGVGSNTGTGALTGVRFYAQTGNIASGTFRLYGLKKP